MNYKPILKEHFLTLVKKLLDGDENNDDNSFPYTISPKLEKDFSKINFDWENYTGFDDKAFAKYPVGYEELTKDFHVFWVNAGGDWEYPICFIFYWDGTQLRAYIPTDGNVWDKKRNEAYGNDDENEVPANYKLDKLISKEKMVEEILLNFKNN